MLLAGIAERLHVHPEMRSIAPVQVGQLTPVILTRASQVALAPHVEDREIMRTRSIRGLSPCIVKCLSLERLLRFLLSLLHGMYETI